MSITPNRHVAVFDIGKTNAKLLLFDRHERRELVAITRPNTSRRGPPYMHFDTDALERLLLDGLRETASAARIDAIVVSTHGASAALLDEDGLVLPPLDYDDVGPDETADAYERIRPPFDITGSPRLGTGLNLGAQLYWQQQRFPEAFASVSRIVAWPQYWSWHLTGVAASEVTSLACHSDLWDLRRETFSGLVDRMEIRHLFPPLRRAHEVLGTLRPQLAGSAGIDYPVPVLCGVHDSNAALVPHLAPAGVPRTIISTGTWITAFAPGVPVGNLTPEDGVMASVDVLGRVVPNFRFPGGRMYEESHDAVALAERTAAGVASIGGRGEALVLGPFARNEAFLEVLAQRLDGPLRAELHHGGISEGAAMLTELEKGTGL